MKRFVRVVGCAVIAVGMATCVIDLASSTRKPMLVIAVVGAVSLVVGVAGLLAIGRLG